MRRDHRLPRALRRLRAILCALTCACARVPDASAQPASAPHLRYHVDMSVPSTRAFAVTLEVDSLTPRDSTFEFASTAPGTYQVMDIGRFVRGFEALDKNGDAVGTERIAVNRWKFSAPERVRTIRYRIRATRDTTVKENAIYAMCATLLREDYALINGQAVFGFPSGMQAEPLSVRLQYPGTWQVGTAMPLRDGAYFAESYDQLVDSPIMLGRLTHAVTTVTGVPVEVYTYSRTGAITAQQLLGSMQSMLESTGKFLGKLPVDRYVFLWEFGTVTNGAWEHSLSSEYVISEAPFTPAFGAAMTDIAAHEFFHIVTPLNIHSEIIEHFNFATPVPSRHLWLYEGTTEWAAHMLQLQAGRKPLDRYLQDVVGKLLTDRRQYDSTYSLIKLALTTYSDSGQAQYSNIYSRGAVVAGLLDIRLLELSGGTRGLRDLILDLASTYGKQRAFPEDSLIDIIVRRTSPEIRAFFADYIEQARPLPVKDYYAKLGISLEVDDKGMPVRFTVDEKASAAQVRLREAWLGRRAGTTP